jgi:hypothetical protein
VEESWFALFRFIMFWMKTGYRDTKAIEEAEMMLTSKDKGK